MLDKKDPYDYTSGQRATKHLERLTSSKGKRLPVDLAASHVSQLDELIAAGYGKTAVAAIRKAIEDAHAGLFGQAKRE